MQGWVSILQGGHIYKLADRLQLPDEIVIYNGLVVPSVRADALRLPDADRDLQWVDKFFQTQIEIFYWWTHVRIYKLSILSGLTVEALVSLRWTIYFWIYKSSKRAGSYATIRGPFHLRSEIKWNINSCFFIKNVLHKQKHFNAQWHTAPSFRMQIY